VRYLWRSQLGGASTLHSSRRAPGIHPTGTLQSRSPDQTVHLPAGTLPFALKRFGRAPNVDVGDNGHLNRRCIFGYGPGFRRTAWIAAAAARPLPPRRSPSCRPPRRARRWRRRRGRPRRAPSPATGCASVGQCRLTPVSSRVHRAWFQRLKVTISFQPQTCYSTWQTRALWEDSPHTTQLTNSAIITMLSHFPTHRA